MRWLPLLLLPGCIDWSSLYQSRCGNGRVEPGEECDDGNGSDTDACLSTCKWATCADGHVRTGVEECDDGNAIDGDGCSSKCLLCNSGDDNFASPENGHCYSRHDEMVTWGAAEATCDARNGYLATLVSSHEAEALESALLGTVTASTWIGMSDSATSGTYSWLTYEPVQFSKWAGTMIQNGCAVERSMPAPSGRPSVDWATVPCDRMLGFVCEQTPPIIRPENHHAYLPLYARVSWFDARATCARMGGHLVTIEDQAENDFVASLTPGEFWIGALEITDGGADPADASCPSNPARASRYEWVTDSPVNATFFAPGEPDHADCAQCLIMGVDKGWHDRACSDPAWYSPYVCEME